MTASSPRPARSRDTLPLRERILWSSLGAIAPIILSLLNIDFTILLSNFDWGALLGTVAQLFVYIFAATIVVHFYQDEHSRSKLFHLGLAAPAFLAALIGQADPNLNAANTLPSSASLPLVSVAFAQPSVSDLCQSAAKDGYDVQTVTPHEPGFVAQFVRGFTGKRPLGENYVVVDSFSNAEAAEEARAKLDGNAPSTVLCGDFALSRNADTPFVLMLGNGLLKEEAQQLRENVVALGFEDAYIWTP